MKMNINSSCTFQSFLTTLLESNTSRRITLSLGFTYQNKNNLKVFIYLFLSWIHVTFMNTYIITIISQVNTDSMERMCNSIMLYSYGSEISRDVSTDN